MNHSLKYYNCDIWLEPLKRKDREFYAAILNIHDAICYADDIADRKAPPSDASLAVWRALIGVDKMMSFPNHWAKVKPVLQIILESEHINLNYIPGENDLEKELGFWETRASLLDFYRVCLSCINDDYNKSENLQWFNKFKKYCLIHNDCIGLLEDDYEDLIQLRRNYVVLDKFGPEGYFNWKEKTDAFKKHASKILEDLEIEDPSDKIMRIFLKGKDYAEQSILPGN